MHVTGDSCAGERRYMPDFTAIAAEDTKTTLFRITRTEYRDALANSRRGRLSSGASEQKALGEKLKSSLDLSPSVGRRKVRVL